MTQNPNDVEIQEFALLLLHHICLATEMEMLVEFLPLIYEAMRSHLKSKNTQEARSNMNSTYCQLVVERRFLELIEAVMKEYPTTERIQTYSCLSLAFEYATT
jgi:hypothetical protein